MKLIDNAEVQKFHFLGNYQQTLAGADQGLKTFEVWRVSLAPGNEIPEIRHEGEVAALTLQGTGRIAVDDERWRSGRYHPGDPCRRLAPGGQHRQGRPGPPLDPRLGHGLMVIQDY